MTNCTDTSAQSFDAAAALESTRANRAVARRRRWRPSQLARYRAVPVAAIPTLLPGYALRNASSCRTRQSCGS